MAGPIVLPYPELINSICELLPPGQNLYLVGGAVRDMLLQRDTDDIDLVTKYNVRKLARTVADRVSGAFYMLDDERETARIICPEKAGLPNTIDIAMMRSETLAGDLRSRDFTINAMAVDLGKPDMLIDPLGGVHDLEKSRLLPCSHRAFLDDPLRILRSVRLAHDFKLEFDESLFPLIDQALPSLTKVSAERIRDELFRILDGDHVTQGIQLLEKLGVLMIEFPELDMMQGEDTTGMREHGVWGHKISTIRNMEILCISFRKGKLAGAGTLDQLLVEAWKGLDRYKKDIDGYLDNSLSGGRTLKGLLFLACLYLESPGNVNTPAEPGPSRQPAKTIKEGSLIRKRGRALALSIDEMEYLDRTVNRLVEVRRLTRGESTVGGKEIYKFFRSTGDAGVGICILSLAELRATLGDENAMKKWQAGLSACVKLFDAWWGDHKRQVDPPRLLNGDDLKNEFGLKPGPQVGALLEAIREAQADGEVTNHRDALKFAGDWLKQAR